MSLDHRRDRIRGLGHRTFPVACCSRTVDGLAHARREQRRPRPARQPARPLPARYRTFWAETTRPVLGCARPLGAHPYAAAAVYASALPRRCWPAHHVRGQAHCGLERRLVDRRRPSWAPQAVRPAHRPPGHGHRSLTCGQVGDLGPGGCADDSRWRPLPGSGLGDAG